jgi:hypothetical protein
LVINAGTFTLKNGNVIETDTHYGSAISVGSGATVKILSGYYQGMDNAVSCSGSGTLNIVAGQFVCTNDAGSDGCLVEYLGGQINIEAGSTANVSPWKNAAGATNVTIAVDNTPPTLTAGTVSRTSDAEATVKFTSNEAGLCYYQVVADNAGDPNIDTSGAGAPCAASEVIIPLTSLTAGAKDVWIYFKDAAGNIGKLKIDIPAYTPGGGGGGCNAGAAGLLAVSGVARAIMKRAGKKSKK